MKIPAPRAALLDARLVLRHQIAAFLTTVADFTAMVLLVELAMVPPPIATVFSAIFGGVVNFSLSRFWAYRRRHRGGFTSQVRRYAATSLGGALLNGDGATATITGAELRANAATAAGGGIWAAATATTTGAASVIEGNAAPLGADLFNQPPGGRFTVDGRPVDPTEPPRS